MRSTGINIIYNEETYAARLVNFTIDTATPSDSRDAPQPKSRSYNLLLLVVLVCVLVPLVVAAFVLIVIVVVKVCRLVLMLVVLFPQSNGDIRYTCTWYFSRTLLSYVRLMA